jgi:hypothetical protein
MTDICSDFEIPPDGSGTEVGDILGTGDDEGYLIVMII